MSEKKKSLLNGKTIYLIAAVLLILFLVKEYSNVYRECYVEAGVDVALEEFFKVCNEEVSLAMCSDEINTKVPGEYHLTLKKGNLSFRSTLYVTDTIAPIGKGINKTIGYGEKCEATDFVSEIVDATTVTVEYKKQPDFELIGKQEVEILLKDLGENETVVLSELIVTPLRGEVLVEAGSEPPTLDRFVIEGVEAEIITDISVFDYSIPEEHEVDIKVNDEVYTSSLVVVDTIAPKIQVQDIQGFLNVPYTAEDFVVSVEDATKVTAKFVKEPSMSEEGEQPVEICVVDAGGNEVFENAKIILSKDIEAPKFEKIQDIRVFVGDSVSYKKEVTVTDNCPKGLELEIDNSKVNLSVEGTYPVTYIAKDIAGNETKASVNVIVKTNTYNEEDVNALADKVLSKILKEGMSLQEKIEKIYYYTRGNIRYISHSEKGNWVRAAYEGLVDKQGDCYVYACTAKVLLTRAGITNMDIEKIPAKTRHYWNLVDIGDGWYHFDPTPRKDGTIFFMWTEEELMNYSVANDNSHNYDHSLYPTVN